MIAVCEAKLKSASLTRGRGVLCVRETPHTPQSVPLTAATLCVREAHLSHSGSYPADGAEKARGNASQSRQSLFRLSDPRDGGQRGGAGAVGW